MGSELRVLQSGDAVDSNGLHLQFSASIPELIAGTSSEPAGFEWKWMLLGRIFVLSGGDVREFDGGLMIGQHQERVYALALPDSDGEEQFLYLDVELEAMKISPRVKKPLFGRPKVEIAVVQLSDELGIAAHVANRLGPTGIPDPSNELLEYCVAFGAVL